jgi:quercetin dioxygenase-like cupin family protein
MISKRTSRCYVTNADTAPAYWMIGVVRHVLATSVQTGNAMCLLDQLCSKGSGPARHTHPQGEGLYVASGKVTFNAGGLELVAGTGSLVTVPRRTEHSFIVDDEAILINFYFPAGFDLWLMGSALPAQRNELPPPEAPMPPYQLTKQLSDD